MALSGVFSLFCSFSESAGEKSLYNHQFLWWGDLLINLMMVKPITGDLLVSKHSPEIPNWKTTLLWTVAREALFLCNLIVWWKKNPAAPRFFFLGGTTPQKTNPGDSGKNTWKSYAHTKLWLYLLKKNEKGTMSGVTKPPLLPYSPQQWWWHK